MSSIGIEISIISALFAEAIIPRNFSTEVIHSILPFPAGGLLGVISELLVLRHNTNGLKRRYWRIQLRVDSNLLARISGVVLTRTRLRYSHWLLIESSASSYHRGRIRIAILLVKIHFYLFLNTMNFIRKNRDSQKWLRKTTWWIGMCCVSFYFGMLLEMGVLHKRSETGIAGQ